MSKTIHLKPESPHPSRKHFTTVMVKPIGAFCNLHCTYCYYLDKADLYPGPPAGHRMNDETLEKLIADMFRHSPMPTFIWQGGEPTVLGLGFFEKVVRLQKKYAQGKKYSNALQTSGFLLNQDWADFLKEEMFLVGFSMDGPQHIQDRYRLDRMNQGTFDKVYENAQLLIEKEVQVNVLATVNDYSVKYAREIYKFFVDTGFMFMQFSPVVERDPHNAKAVASFSVSARAYGHFLNEVFDAWLEDFDFDTLQQKTSVRFFDSILHTYIGLDPMQCVLHKHCNDYLVVEHNGDLYSCDFLVGERNTQLGNLHDVGMKEAFYSPEHLAFGQQKAALDMECRRCKWLQQCYGGCVKDRIRDPADKGHNHFCESFKIFFEHSHKEFKKLGKLYQTHYMGQD